jgi:hypothetical protein
MATPDASDRASMSLPIRNWHVSFDVDVETAAR